MKIDRPFPAYAAIRFLVLAASVLCGVRRLAADGPVYMDSQRVLDNFGKPGGNPLIPGEAYRVQTDRRTANGNIEIHEKETDIFYIMDGSASIVVGGTAVDPKPTQPGQMTAKDIANGQTYNLKKGDVLVIPAAALVQAGQRIYQLLDRQVGQAIGAQFDGELLHLGVFK